MINEKEQCSRETEIPMEIENLLKDQELLGQIIKKLEVRLGPVLRIPAPAPPPVMNKADESSTRKTELGKKLCTAKQQARDSRDIIGSVINRLEI